MSKTTKAIPENVTGWDVQASASVCHGGGPPDQGEVVVATNNQDVYVVGFRASAHDDSIRVKSALFYDDGEKSVENAYSTALDLMVKLAKEN